MYFLLHLFMFPLCFMVLLEHLQRLYRYSSIFKYCQCIITTTAPATLAVATLATLTSDYEVLTNQEDALVSVYIDSVALQLNLSHHSNSILVLYVLCALNPDLVSHRVIQTLISKRIQISSHLIPPLEQYTIVTTCLYPITAC